MKSVIYVAVDDVDLSVHTTLTRAVDSILARNDRRVGQYNVNLEGTNSELINVDTWIVRVDKEEIGIVYAKSLDSSH